VIALKAASERLKPLSFIVSNGSYRRVFSLEGYMPSFYLNDNKGAPIERN
jgi:hypothetical protein